MSKVRFMQNKYLFWAHLSTQKKVWWPGGLLITELSYDKMAFNDPGDKSLP